ncbi:MAG: glycine cleavage system protein H [Planctomycetota bacterium]|jgi:glycine cleavage system H protein
MVVLLVVLTFATFIFIDYLLSRRASEREALAEEMQAAAIPVPVAPPEPEPALAPVWVAGYELPEHLHYHRGHTWAKVIAPDTATVGIDDFARKFIGEPSEVELPNVGSYLRQGGTGVRLAAEGRATDLISPVDGEVVAVNTDLRRDPGLPARDPYGRGWLYKIRSTNLSAALRNLLSGSLARRWTEDAREQMELRLMALSGSVVQDGGEPAPDFARHVPAEDWKGLVEKFFLTEGHEEVGA